MDENKKQPSLANGKFTNDQIKALLGKKSVHEHEVNQVKNIALKIFLILIFRLIGNKSCVISKKGKLKKKWKLMRQRLWK